VYIYGYTFPLNPNKVVASLSVYNDINIKIVAIDEVSQPAQVSLSAGTTQAPMAANQIGITTANTYQEGAIDAAGESFSSAALGSTIPWNQQTFAVGPADVNDIMQWGGVSI
jgi:hypothetical protein